MASLEFPHLFRPQRVFKQGVLGLRVPDQARQDDSCGAVEVMPVEHVGEQVLQKMR